MSKMSLRNLTLAAVLAAVYAVAGFAPFGEKTLLTVDMNGQYVAFFSQLRSILLGKDDLLYTFGKALGGDMIGLFAYYIALNRGCDIDKPRNLAKSVTVE